LDITGNNNNSLQCVGSAETIIEVNAEVVTICGNTIKAGVLAAKCRILRSSVIASIFLVPPPPPPPPSAISIDFVSPHEIPSFFQHLQLTSTTMNPAAGDASTPPSSIKAPRKRKRIVISCTECHRRKQKVSFTPPRMRVPHPGLAVLMTLRVGRIVACCTKSWELTM
jgi:hypothetical protein